MNEPTLIQRANQWLSEVRGVDDSIRMRNAIRLVTALRDELEAAAALPACQESETQPEQDINDGRCESHQPETGYRCGMRKGHRGSHTVLIPTNEHWAK